MVDREKVKKYFKVGPLVVLGLRIVIGPLIAFISMTAGSWKGGMGVTTQWVYRDTGRTMYLSFMADRLVSKGEVTE